MLKDTIDLPINFPLKANHHEEFKTILGIDTSCDDTGIGIVKNGKVVANIVASQTALHQVYGGVMPEAASREHLQVIDNILQQALQQANLTLDDIDVVAATYGPGLVGALLVGLTFAKSLAYAQKKPFFPIHHLEGHMAATTAEPPFLCLLASGGHTSLFDVPAWGKYHLLGQSRDDAAGEAFDKVARLLGLPYPGGAPLSQLAKEGDANAYAFTLPLKQQTGFDFSFSGLKTAVATLLETNPNANPADVAASFEHTVVKSLLHVTKRALKHTQQHTQRTKLVVAGGVAANHKLRAALDDLPNVTVHVPPFSLTTDNGAMIALAAYQRLSHELSPAVNFPVDAVPYAPLDISL